MKTKQIIAVLILVSIFSVVTQLQAQMANMPADHIMIMPDSIKWVDAPSSFPPGAKIAVIEGDPNAAGLFTMRLKLPANYRVMPHSHPADEHLTIIEGSFYMGLGEKFDEKAVKEIPTGGFAVMKTGTRHYAMTKKECIIQTHGMGPWGITYVNAADDPRNKKKN
ncbi:MAG: cupin domain-containing protein [Bacteroidia bacterium]